MAVMLRCQWTLV